MMQFNLPQNEMAQRILMAAEALMAREGAHNLSTHKIAKEAKLSVGTIYLHYKDKDDLLRQLVLFLFQRLHQAVAAHFNPDLSLFALYREMWLAKWRYLRENPSIVMNLHQYESLPQFREVIQFCSYSEDLPLNRLISLGKQQNQIMNLPNSVIYALSFGVAHNLIYLEHIQNTRHSDAVIEEVILRTWKAISL